MFCRRCLLLALSWLVQLLHLGVVAFSFEFQKEGVEKTISSSNLRFDQVNLYYPEYASIDNAESEMRLPVFPLRKAVKLPSEELTLNLYEDRYLELATYVLQQRPKPCFFGALYCATKPQMVSGAIGPVTPLVEPGDIGVIFLVVENEDGMIPSVGGSLRRRIRLNGVAIGRFRIERVIQNGYSPDSKPFILVEASKIEDELVLDRDDEMTVASLEQELLNKLTETNKEVSDFPVSRQGNEEEDDTSIPINSMRSRPLYERDQLLTQALSAVGRPEDAEERYRREIFSFFALSQLKGSAVPPMDILRHLQSSSTKERLAFATQLYQKRPSWNFTL